MSEVIEIPDEDLKDAKQLAGTIEDITRMANRVIDTEEEIDKLEKQTKKKKADLHRLQSQELPDIMGSMTEFKLESGHEVIVEKFTKAGLPTKQAIIQAGKRDENKKIELETRLEEGLTWLRDPKIGGKSLIKNKLAVEFSAGQDNMVGEFVAKAEELGLPVNRTTEVHPASLGKFVKEKMEKGVAVPMDVLGVYCGRKAVVKKPKKGK